MIDIYIHKFSLFSLTVNNRNKGSVDTQLLKTAVVAVRNRKRDTMTCSTELLTGRGLSLNPANPGSALPHACC